MASKDTSMPQPEKVEGVDGVRIAWDYSSAKQLAATGGYARVLRIKDGTLLAVYEDRRGNSMLIRSGDNGETWGEPLKVFSKFTASKDGKSTDVNIANPEIYQLQDGSLIMGVNYRPAIAEIYPFAIVVTRSTDNGYTWTTPQMLYEAAPRFKDGCWEPAFLQLPNGQLQVYFANENPYQSSDEQEISMLASEDNGITWSNNTTKVSFRAGRRDGMPVPVIANDEILVCIEDNKIDQFKPYIVRTKISDSWKTPVLAESPNRSYALKEALPNSVYAGAPYIAKLASGELVISYQTTDNRTADWEMSTMEVAIGDKSGNLFTKKSRPFDVPLNKEAKWNSISNFDEFTLLAVASSNFDGNDVGVWIKKGYIIPELRAKTSSVVVDGIPNESEWGKRYPVFIGSKGETHALAAISTDGTNLCFGVKVNDKTPFADPKDKLKADGVTIYIDSRNSCSSIVDEGCYRIWCSYKGDVKMYKGKAGKWSEVSAGKIKVAAKANSLADGYVLEVAVPLSSVEMVQSNDIRINFGLSAFQSSLVGYEETIVNSNPNQPFTWCKVNFK